MKKRITIVSLFLVVLAASLNAQAQTVFSKGTALPYNVSVLVTLNKNGPFPMANISFRVGNVSAGNLTLSPMQPSSQNLNYTVMRQSLTINSITYQPGFGMNQDSIFVVGSVTDANGNNRMPFSMPLL